MSRMALGSSEERCKLLAQLVGTKVARKGRTSIKASHLTLLFVSCSVLELLITSWKLRLCEQRDKENNELRVYYSSQGYIYIGDCKVAVTTNISAVLEFSL